MLPEHSIGVYRRVLVAKQSVDALAVLVVKVLEAVFRLILVFLDERLVHIELLYTVQTWVLKLLGACHAMAAHGVAHLQGRVHTDAVVAAQLLSIHAAHRGADDEVGLFLSADVTQQAHSLRRVYGQVWGNDSGLRHDGAQPFYRARLSAGGKTVTIENGLSCHHVRKLFDVWVFCYHGCKGINKYRKVVNSVRKICKSKN